MAYWDSEQQQIVHHEPKPYPHSPGWKYVDCGCCNGIMWGGDYPRECPDCGGNGSIAWHVKSNRLALYPGGPFVGSIPKGTTP